MGLVLVTQGPSQHDRRRDVIRLSQRFAVALSSYDYRHLDADFAGVRSMSTAGFQDEYNQLLGGQQFVDALRQSQAVSTATIQTGPLLATLTRDDARTFTVVNQKIVNASNSQPQLTRTRIELYLVQTVSGWKVDRVDIQ
jgi:Mce-associated membrane protein